MAEDSATAIVADAAAPRVTGGDAGADARGGDRRGERILVLAPRGRNARMLEGVLARAGLVPHVCDDVAHLCRGIADDEPGAVVLAEEALVKPGLDALVDALTAQPAWSELPILVLTGGGRTTRESLHVARALGPHANITLLERPVRIITLVSAVQTALRARRRQYEVRDLLAREHAARAEAEAASAAKDQFLATLSHELRTPLTPVLMSVAALSARDGELPASVREDLDMIRRNVELEARLIDDLLDLTRVAKGKLELHHEAADVHAVLRHAVGTCADADVQAGTRAIELELAADRHHVWGDPARLSQVFWNLLKNAIKFTPAGGTIRVRTRDGADGRAGHAGPAAKNGADAARDPGPGAVPSTIAVEVSDSGMGIEPAALGRIFSAFEQEDRTVTRQFGGLGLGLAITRALVGFHGGTITAHSDGRGKGATFTVTLPTIDAPAPPAKRARFAGGAAGAGDGGPLSVLLVEDHDSTSKVMAKLLRALSYDVALAGDVATAKQTAARRRFDVVISDLGLPDGSGWDLIRHLRANHGPPAIALSGFGMEEDVKRSREAGFAEHLVKPIDFEKLNAAIRRVTGR